MSVTNDHSQKSPPPSPRRISLLGATGSVGRSTVDLLERNPDVFSVSAVAGGSDVAGLADIARRVKAEFAAIRDENAYEALKEALAGTNIKLALDAQRLLRPP